MQCSFTEGNGSSSTFKELALVKENAAHISVVTGRPILSAIEGELHEEHPSPTTGASKQSKDSVDSKVKNIPRKTGSSSPRTSDSLGYIKDWIRSLARVAGLDVLDRRAAAVPFAVSQAEDRSVGPVTFATIPFDIFPVDALGVDQSSSDLIGISDSSGVLSQIAMTTSLLRNYFISEETSKTSNVVPTDGEQGQSKNTWTEMNTRNNIDIARGIVARSRENMPVKLSANAKDEKLKEEDEAAIDEMRSRPKLPRTPITGGNAVYLDHGTPLANSSKVRGFDTYGDPAEDGGKGLGIGTSGGKGHGGENKIIAKAEDENVDEVDDVYDEDADFPEESNQENN